MERIPAARVQIGAEVFLRKTCLQHGTFSSIIWRGFYDINSWVGNADKPASENPKCPDGCGPCEDHLQKTCCVLLNVTNRCNLTCRFCFADQADTSIDPTLDEIRESIFQIVEKDKTLLQLSGGEPTVRDDLPAIIKTAKEAGAKYVQLNSNGIRLGEDKQYIKELADAGLSFVFMQFDGTEDSINESLRGKPLLKIKQQAIENCAEYNVGVSLAVTLVRGINTDNIGSIIRFAMNQSPKVRGVHFQPVTFIGRTPVIPKESDRITLDELVFELCKQSSGMIKATDILPSACDHPLCGFHGDFIVDKDILIPLSKRSEAEKTCCCDTAAEKNREFVARRWQRLPTAGDSCCGDIHDMDYFLNKVKINGFTLTAMAFQDAGNIDFSRLRNCSFHVYDHGNFVPFCAYYLSGWKH
jgi:uncharacterized radical SAM superfamily Fe-S cluster-containing enzyme